MSSVVIFKQIVHNVCTYVEEFKKIIKTIVFTSQCPRNSALAIYMLGIKENPCLKNYDFEIFARCVYTRFLKNLFCSAVVISPEFQL